MSGRVILGAVGAVIGFIVSGYNPYGAQVGWMVGPDCGELVDGGAW